MNSISSMASSWASNLFTQLDTKNQGYIEKSDLQSAFSKVSDSSSTSVDDVFSQLDGDSDGKVTKDEMTSALQKVAEQLDSQFNNMRMQGGSGPGGPGGPEGMPPPPPPEDDAGFTKDELASQLEDIGSSDSKRSSLISNVLDNFDSADSDGDGKVTFKEAIAYDHASQNGSTTSTSTTTSTSSSDISTTASTQNTDASVMLKIMQLMQAYQVFGQDQQQNGYAALSISA